MGLVWLYGMLALLSAAGATHGTSGQPSPSGSASSSTTTETTTTWTTTTVFDPAPPRTTLTRPEHDRTYGHRRLRSIKGVTTAYGSDEGLPIHISVRKKLRSGACKWLMDRGAWVEKPCAQPVGTTRSHTDEAGRWLWRLPVVLKQTGRRIRNYVAYARDTSGRGSPFSPEGYYLGDNKNRFFITD